MIEGEEMQINKNYIKASLKNNGIDINDVETVIVENNIVKALDKHDKVLYSRDLTGGETYATTSTKH